ncbi:MAG: response regulator [Betaproteobacteria bacterium]
MSSNLSCDPQWPLPAAAGLADQSLAQWLAHELRNPLAPIATAAELLLSQAGDEQTRQLGSIIERHAQQLRSLIDELVDAASRDRAWVAPLDLAMAAGPGGADQLPLLFGSGAQAGAAISSVAAADVGLRILVVDDNADAAALLGQFLQSLGHEVRVLTDPLAALAAAQTFEPQVGLLDIAMPVMDGYELARRLMQLPGRADLRLAAVTAFSQPSDRQAAERVGFEQYFVKPLDVCGLQDWLTQIRQCACA